MLYTHATLREKVMLRQRDFIANDDITVDLRAGFVSEVATPCCTPSVARLNVH